MTVEQFIVVLTTLPNKAGAEGMARALVAQRLIACASCLPGARSIYRWQGAIEEADECLLWMKTTAARYQELEAAIKAAHPYDVPEIIAIPVAAGLPAYLAWVAAETSMNSNA